ncbi:lipase family protein [Sphingosinithalassobacter sp. LHW66-3]|uniref:lipase family protein n=1 Tax=Sphingosinithalassobacter sp. LHW66-3 TaxID=3424718 RepID=UPI003D6AC7FC
MIDCMKRRLLYAASQAYHPQMETVRRSVGWTAPPLVVQRRIELWQQPIDLALVGAVPDGVIVAFRGSLPPFFGGRHDGWTVLLDWLNGGLSVCRADPDYCGAGVHWGFAESMARLWNDSDEGPGVKSAVQTLLDRGARRHLFVTGHSKGGALANLAAYRAARLAGWRDMPISVATIASARAGNAAFAKAYAAERIACLRYELPGDPIPHLPIGPASPRWARQLARQVWPGLADSDYHSVGERVAPADGSGVNPRDWRTALAGINLARFTPSAIASHAICPDSGYDRLICLGETGCTHGAAPPPPRRHDREGTRSTVPARWREHRRRSEPPELPDPGRERRTSRLS